MVALLDEYGKPMARTRAPRPASSVRETTRARSDVQASMYDSAQTSAGNKYYWAGSDASDADRSNMLAVRKSIRERARYVVANDPLAKGIVLTKAAHEIGPSGPTLQVLSGARRRNKQIEAAWNTWCEEIGFAEKLNTITQARIVDGEGWGWKRFNPTLSDPVKLDWWLFECDQVMTPWLPYAQPNRIDGVWFDDFGRPTFYDILRWHPGGVYPMPSLLYDTWPANFFTHCFRADRPQQHRGVSEISPSLELFAQRKLYLRSVIRAAQNAAKLSVLLETEAPADGSAANPADVGEAELPDGMVAALPYGMKAHGFEPKQPTQTLEMFDGLMVGRIARCLSMPLNIAACDSSKYNFASGRLDHQTYFSGEIKVCQRRTERQACDSLFRDWFREANLVYRWGYGPGAADNFTPQHVWHWTEPEYSDPEAEAKAIQNALAIGIASHSQVLSRSGLDVEAVFEKSAEALGFADVDEYRLWVRQNIATPKGGMQGGVQPQGQQPTAEEVAAMARMICAGIPRRKRPGYAMKAVRAFAKMFGIAG